MPPAERLPFRASIAGEAYEHLNRLPVRVLLDNVRSAYNTGAFFRTGDAAGVEGLLLCGITPRPPQSAISKTALGAEDTLAWAYDWDALAAASALRHQGYELAVVETSNRSVDLFDWQPRFPVCVLFGHETDGLQPALLDIADTHVRIPMLGYKHSLNVATAGGVVLYELLRKYRVLVKG